MFFASNGKALFTLRALNRNLEAVAKAISADFCLPGLGDAGAHVNQTRIQVGQPALLIGVGQRTSVCLRWLSN